ncbi:hypothetical protein [Novosphingobium sp. FSW06-99]|uniref:hypothetical protein n=1 Tax=Novosphingobium sp. FSW06-99 TaxID=1739113 RepID=UPI00076C733B|nr:hypothetical protein [Novosphingobium sp. FSW06-99]KUR73863.1 hypothetical protein AQZ49_19885 [Novosphingobium sp. FSW06-99]
MKGVMKIVRRSPPADLASTIAVLEDQLRILNGEGSKLYSRIEDLTAQQDELTETDDLLTSMAGIKAAQNRIRKIDAEIIEVKQRLDIARDAARAARLDSVRAEFFEAADEFLAKAHDARLAAEKMIAGREAIRSEGFGHEYSLTPIPPMIGAMPVLAADLLETFAANLQRSRSSSQRKSAQRQTPATTGLPPKEVGRSAAAGPSEAKAKTAPQPNNSSMFARHRDPLREVAREGQRLVVMLRSGVDGQHRGNLQSGDVIAVDHDHAVILMRNGAAELAAPTPMQENPATVAPPEETLL